MTYIPMTHWTESKPGGLSIEEIKAALNFEVAITMARKAPKDEAIEQFYSVSDPWNYQNNPEDHKRKWWIIGATSPFMRFERALDIGCGEGWITKDLPAKEIHGIELSRNASARVPDRVKMVDAPEGKYDLVVCTGALYDHYDHRQMRDWIDQAAEKIIVISHSENIGNPTLPYEQIYFSFFPYHDTKQIMRVYRV